jgi:hypothetical protein
MFEKRPFLFPCSIIGAMICLMILDQVTRMCLSRFFRSGQSRVYHHPVSVKS